MKDAFQFRPEFQGVKSYWQLCDFHGRASDGVWFWTQQDNWASLSTLLHSILRVGEMGVSLSSPSRPESGYFVTHQMAGEPPEVMMDLTETINCGGGWD